MMKTTALLNHSAEKAGSLPAKDQMQTVEKEGAFAVPRGGGGRRDDEGVQHLLTFVDPYTRCRLLWQSKGCYDSIVFGPY